MATGSASSSVEVLLVEDEPRLRDMLLRAVREMGFRPTGASSAEQAMRLMDQSPHPIVVVDLNLPGASGMDFLRDVRRRWPGTQAIILTGFGDLDAAKMAIHLDVVDFLTKPCALGDVEIALSRAAQRVRQDAVANHPVMTDEAVAAEASTPQREQESSGVTPPVAGEGLKFTPWEGNEALSIEEVEKQTILAVLKKHGRNRTAAAAELGISVRKLYYRLAQYRRQGHHI